MTGIICLTLKYTVNTVLMKKEGSVSHVCAHIHGHSPTSEENNCRIKEG